MAAHDLRNPLGIIVGMVELLVEELAGSLSEENRELLARVATWAEYMQGLIDDMLDFTKVDAGRLERAATGGHCGADCGEPRFQFDPREQEGEQAAV